MSVSVQLSAWQDVARVIDGLLEAAAAVEEARPALARAYRDLADRVGDALDELPHPSAFRAQVEHARFRHVEMMERER